MGAKVQKNRKKEGRKLREGERERERENFMKIELSAKWVLKSLYHRSSSVRNSRKKHKKRVKRRRKTTDTTTERKASRGFSLTPKSEMFQRKWTLTHNRRRLRYCHRRRHCRRRRRTLSPEISCHLSSSLFFPLWAASFLPVREGKHSKKTSSKHFSFFSLCSFSWIVFLW